MKKLNVQKLTLCGVMAALVFVMTYFPKIPVPVTGGYVHLGDGGRHLPVRAAAWPAGNSGGGGRVDAL